jgi:hypothetical protein
MKHWIVVVVLSLGLASTGPSAAQEMENIKPGPEHAILKKGVGTWDAEVDMGPMGGKSKGTMTFKEGPGGIWFISEFKAALGGNKFEGVGITGWDPQKKMYVGTWTDSMSTRLSPIEGTYDPATKTMTETMTSVGPDGRPARMENVTVFKSDDEQTFTMSLIMPDGSKQKMMTINYTRKK